MLKKTSSTNLILLPAAPWWLLFAYIFSGTIGLCGLAAWMNPPQHWDLAGILLLVSGISAASIADRLFDRQIPSWTSLQRKLYAILFMIFCAFGMYAWCLADDHRRWWVCGLACLSLSYPVCQRISGAKTVIVTLAWYVALCVLPSPQASDYGWPAHLAVVTLIAASAMLCDLKDIPRDRESKKSLITLLGDHLHRRLVASLLMSSLLLMLATWWFNEIAGLQFLVMLPVIIMLALLNWRDELLRKPYWGSVIVDGILAMSGLRVLGLI